MGAQQGDQQHGEVATGADDTVVEGTRFGEGSAVVLIREPEDLLRGPSVGFAAAALRKLDAVRRSDVLVKQQPLSDARQGRHVARERDHFGGVRAGRRHLGRRSIELEDAFTYGHGLPYFVDFRIEPVDAAAGIF